MFGLFGINRRLFLRQFVTIDSRDDASRISPSSKQIDKGLTLETSALEFLYGSQILLMKPNIQVENTYQDRSNFHPSQDYSCIPTGACMYLDGTRDAFYTPCSLDLAIPCHSC